MNGSHCGNLVEKTAAALNEEAVMLMLVAVQRGNVDLSVKLACRWCHGLPDQFGLTRSPVVVARIP
jgi:hypothetical protein